MVCHLVNDISISFERRRRTQVQEYLSQSPYSRLTVREILDGRSLLVGRRNGIEVDWKGRKKLALRIVEE